MGNRSEETVFQQCGRGDCPAADNATDFEEPESWVIDVLLGVYVAFNIVGIVVTYFFVMPLPRSEWTNMTSTRDSVMSVFVTLRNTSIGLLVPLFIFQGIQQAVLYSEFTRSYISCPLGIHMVGFVMAAHGATTPVTTWIFSRVVKLTGRYPLFLLAGFINLGLMLVLYEWTPDDSQAAFIFLVPIAWGISEGIWMTQSNSFLALQYRKEKEPAFAIYHTARSIGLALTFAYSSLLCASIKLTISMSFVLLGLVCYTAEELRIKWKDKRDPKWAAAIEENGVVSFSTMDGVKGLDGNLATPTTTDSAQLPPPSSPPPTPPPPTLDHEFSVQLPRRTSQLSLRVGEVPERAVDFPDSGTAGAGGSAPQLNTALSTSDLASLAEMTLTDVTSRVPTIGSSSSSILSSLTIMARLSQSDDDGLVTQAGPSSPRQRMSGGYSDVFVF